MINNDHDNVSLYSLRTDTDDDVCYRNEPIRALGEEYSAVELRTGVALGDGRRLIMEASLKGDEWVLLTEYIRDGCKEELRRLPRKTAWNQKQKAETPKAETPKAKIPKAREKSPLVPSLDATLALPLDATEPRLEAVPPGLSEAALNVELVAASLDFDLAGPASEAVSSPGGSQLSESGCASPNPCAATLPPRRLTLSSENDPKDDELRTLTTQGSTNDLRKDVEELIALLGREEVSPACELVPRVRAIMSDYIQKMELLDDDQDRSMLGSLSNAMLPLFNKLRAVQHKLMVASKDARPINRTLVVGGEGAGKTTFVNKITKHCTKTRGLCDDGKDKMPFKIEVIDEAIRVDGSRVDGLDKIREAEAALLQKVHEMDEYEDDYNKFKDDIFPTGEVAMTAVVTEVFLNPDLEAGVRKLMLRYRKRDLIDGAIRDANLIRDLFRQTKNEDDIPPEIGRSNLLLQASFACALCQIREESGADAIETVQKYEGEIKIPERLDPLLGCERYITVKASRDGKGDPEEAVWAKVSDLLLLHTVGDWSHWAVLEKVELEVPSRFSKPLYICDVPGFGDAGTQPFRQSVVDAAMALHCSTLCVCMGNSKKNDMTKKGVAERLDQCGIFQDLCSKVATSRRVGTVTTLFPLDRVSTRKPGETEEAWLTRAERLHGRHTEETLQWIRNKVKSALAERRRIATQPVGQSSEDPEWHTTIGQARIKACSIDVRGELGKSGRAQWGMEDMVNVLLDNNRRNLEEQQDECLEQLLDECLLPFYLYINQICELRNLKSDARFQFKAEEPLLKAVQEIANAHLSRAINAKRRNELDTHVISPACEQCTRDAVLQRFDERDGEFAVYSKRGSRKLSSDMRSKTPECTLLPQLCMKPLARDIIGPLQDALYSMLDALVDEPTVFLESLCLNIITRELKKNMESVPTQEEALQSVLLCVGDGLKEETRRMIDTFRRSLLRKIDVSFPQDHLDMMRTALGMEELYELSKTKTRGNREKVLELARTVEGTQGMAEIMRNQLRDYVFEKVLDTHKTEFIKEMERIVRFYAGTVRSAIEVGNITWFEELNGFKRSVTCARRLGGVIQAIVTAGQMRKDLSKYINKLGEKELMKVKELAKQPLVHRAAASDSGTNRNLVVLSPQPVPGGSPSDGGEDAWSCCNCGSTKAEQKGLLELTHLNGICQKKESSHCWCEKQDPTKEVCYLCIRMYKNKHKLRNRTKERDRLMHELKRKRNHGSQI